MTDAAHTEVDLRHRLGTLRLDVGFSTKAPWTVLFGPSGSGKSTILRAIAGFEKPNDGCIRLLGRTVYDSTSRLSVPAHQRPMRWAGQRTALFPRITVRENIACATGASLGHIAFEETAHVLEHFGLQTLAAMRAGELSGGQQHRVAVARAAAGAQGKVLLLDEPFTGLDAAVRDTLIAQLRTWLAGAPVISVTHDVGEASLLAAEVVRLEGGRVVAQGRAAEVLAVERLRLREIL